MATKTQTKFNPVEMPLRGKLFVPGDKSIAQRAIMLAAMAEGTSHIYGVPKSGDVMTVANAVQKLGASVKFSHSKNGNNRNVDCEITGWGALGPAPQAQDIDCGNSATCARVLMGVLTPFNLSKILDGDESLHHRPFMRVVDPLMQMGANFKVVAQKNGKPQRSSLPMEIIGTLEPNALYYEMPVASSQVKTSILFAGANTPGTTTVIEPFQSRDHGELLLKRFRADVEIDKDAFTVSVTGPSQLKAVDINIPGDVSSAAYYLTAAALVPGSKITIENVGINETRLGFVKALERMGARIEIEELDSLDEPVGNITVQYAGRLNSIEVLDEEIPSMIDEIPILALAAACAEGESIFYGIRELKLKESNRIHTISEGLRQLGTRAIDRGDTLYVEGGIDIEAKRSIKPVKKVVELAHHGDHRLAIVWALIGLCGYTPTIVENFSKVSSISYPNFMDDFNELVLEEQ
ncbi:MAG: 3-phosphoshikimate 1-carboxyvinyltransferase [Coriobacteriia bacterium]|nr:3-phosphoshikimate 1-carboxyvinyltransferase [Coriobacteriia bacterium]